MLIVVDGSYYIFRAFYAVREMSNSKGMPTNGLYAFTSMLLNVIRDHKPKYLVVTFDPPGPVFRNELFPDYKANRGDPPEDLIPQFPVFRDIVRALSIPILETPGFEADDVIGSLTKLTEEAGMECLVLSGDKDLAQLVTERTTLLDSMRDKRVGIAEVRERFQVDPSRVADVLGLAGDTSDNIPGVPGIGEKTAGALIAEFGSLEGVLANIASVKGPKRREMLETHAEQARLSLELTTIRRDVEIELPIEGMRLVPPDFEAFDALCHELEFRRFPEQLRKVFPGAAPSPVAPAPAPAPPKAAASPVSPAGQGTLLFGDEQPSAEQASPAPQEADWVQAPTFRLLDTAAALESFLAGISAGGELTLLPLLGADAPEAASLVGMGLSIGAGEGAYVPVAHTDLTASQVSLDVLVAALKGPLQSPAVAKTFHDAKWLLRFFASLGVQVQNLAMDTLLAAYLLEPNHRPYDVEELSREFLGRSPTLLVDIVGTGRKAQPVELVAIPRIAPWVAEQAEAVLVAGGVLRKQLDGLQAELLDTIELPLTRVLARMESTGIRIDRERLEAMSVEFAERIAELRESIQELAGRPFLVSSPQQLSVVLFEDLGLPSKKKGKSWPSTDASVLEELRELHPIVDQVINYREIAKLASTYVDALPTLIHPVTGRIHTHFNQAVAATGRLSSSEPNLQNIPVRTAEGRRIREAFVPEPGWRLIGADYSQIELRVLAHLSADPVLLEAFRKGEDIHRRTAAEVLEIEPEAVTSEQRANAKAINFGLIYGMGVHRLSQETGMSREEAKAYIERYFERIQGVKPYMEKLVEQAKTLGYAETLLGRRRPIPELQGAPGRVFALGERLAKNTPIQGSAADIIKIAMNRVQVALDASGLESRMLLTVHDELVLESPESQVQATAALVREAMESATTLDVPLLVDVQTGPNWANLK